MPAKGAREARPFVAEANSSLCCKIIQPVLCMCFQKKIRKARSIFLRIPCHIATQMIQAIRLLDKKQRPHFAYTIDAKKKQKNAKVGCARGQGRPHAPPTRPAGRPRPRAHRIWLFFFAVFFLRKRQIPQKRPDSLSTPLARHEPCRKNRNVLSVAFTSAAYT